jgi:hypothetical protein
VKPGAAQSASRAQTSTLFPAESLSSLSASAGGYGFSAWGYFGSAGGSWSRPPVGLNLITLPYIAA